MSVKKRIIMITCIAVAALFLSQAVLASPVEGTKILQKIRQNIPVRTFLKEKIATKSSILFSKVKEKIAELKSIIRLNREKLRSLDENTLREKIKELLKSDTFKSILYNLKGKSILPWFPGILLIAAILAAIDATLLTYVIFIVSSPAPVLTALLILFIRLCPIIKWIPKTIWFLFWIGQFTYWVNRLAS